MDQEKYDTCSLLKNQTDNEYINRLKSMEQQIKLEKIEFLKDRLQEELSIKI